MRSSAPKPNAAPNRSEPSRSENEAWTPPTFLKLRSGPGDVRPKILLSTFELGLLDPMDASAVILAVASPPGQSIRGIVRISGAATFGLLHDHLTLQPVEVRSQCGSSQPRHGSFPAKLELSTSLRLPAYAALFPAPHSYTGDDAIELQMPGNPMLLERVIEALLDSASNKGIQARRAEPGEFTARAFFNGRLSLTQAEGVAATIAAQSDAELRAARLLTSNAVGLLAHQLADSLASAL